MSENTTMYSVKGDNLDGPIIFPSISEALDETWTLLSDSSPGFGVRIETVSMTQKELDDLPEHEGY